LSEKILVTGGAGYIGSTLVQDLINLGHEVTVVDNFMYAQASLAHIARHKKLNLVFGDVRNKSLMEPLIKKADVVIPLAAIVGAPACDKNPIAASTINKDSIISLLNSLSKNQRILMPTTNSAYGSGDKNNFCDENSPLNPLSLYAKDKVFVEQVLMEHGNATSFRLATVFGLSARMRLDLLVNNFVFRAVTDGFVIIFEGHFKRNYIHILDVSEAFQLALRKPDEFKGQIFNVGLSEANISKLELCARIQNLVPNFTFIESPLGRDPDQRNYIVSNQKIESCGFKPSIGLDVGLSELVKGLPMFKQKHYSNI
jgi:nucleoside-diphosphate-sugar epimerase